MDGASNYCGKVIDLNKKREERDSHQSGEAFCLFCRHIWIAVAPVGVVFLECPKCNSMKGLFRFVCERDIPHWTCNCGNQFFCVTEDGYYCPNCGSEQWGF